MDSPTPLKELDLVATSVADDLGFVALADVGAVFAACGSQARLIGGHMLTLHAQRWQLGQDLYRETHDVDLGIAKLLVSQGVALETLLAKGYSKVAGNRFARTLPSGRQTKGGPEQALIDVLVPATRTRARKNIRVGDLATTEVPGLASALQRSAVVVAVTMHRLDGEVLQAQVPLPDEQSTLILKALAWKERASPKDAVDIWRALEIAHAAGVKPDGFLSADDKAAREIVGSAFAELTSTGTQAMVSLQNLSTRVATLRHTRVRVLSRSVLGL